MKSSLHLVLIPLPAVGHVNPFKCLAKNLIELGGKEDIKIFITFVLFEQASLANVVPWTHPNVEEIRLELPVANFMELIAYLQDEDAQLLEEVQRRLTQLNGWPRPTAVIADFFMCFARSLATTLNVREWRFMPSPMAPTWYLLRHALGLEQDSANDVVFPGIGPVPRSSLPVISDSPELNERIRRHMLLLPQAHGIIFNDVDSLYGVEDLATYRATFPIAKALNAGPLVWPTARNSLSADENLLWLNSCPSRSVLLVALGSWAPVSDQVMDRLTKALCAADCPVLWAARDLRAKIDASEKRAGRTRLVRWIDQRSILQHPAIGAFLTHCGWNSILESLVLAGIPLICLPLTAEQKLNAHVIQHVWKIGTVLNPTQPPQEILQQIDSTMTSQVNRERARLLRQKISVSNCKQSILTTLLHDKTACAKI